MSAGGRQPAEERCEGGVEPEKPLQPGSVHRTQLIHKSRLIYLADVVKEMNLNGGVVSSFSEPLCEEVTYQ